MVLVFCFSAHLLTLKPWPGPRAEGARDLFDPSPGAVDGGRYEIRTARSGLEEPGSFAVANSCGCCFCLLACFFFLPSLRSPLTPSFYILLIVLLCL